MKCLFSVLALIFLLLVAGYSQKTYPGGLILDDVEYDRLAHSSENIQIDYGQRSIRSKMDLSPFCPEIRHQGEIPSCVGWSAGYGALTMERAIKNGWTDQRMISENANSALFIYNQVSQGNCDMGITMPRALKFLQGIGDCLAKEYDIDVNECDKEASADLFSKAEAYRIQDFIPIIKNGADPEEKIRNTKLVVAQKKPVIVGMMIRRNFYEVGGDESRWFPNIGDTTFAGGHAMVVVGYDDDRFRRPGMELDGDRQGAFKLMNSWGKNWGDRGFVWISYADFARFARHAYAIMLADGAPIDFDMDADIQPATEVEAEALKSIAGTFGFRQFTGEWDNGVPLFKEAAVRLRDGHYVLEGSPRAGDLFQLYVSSAFDLGYVYVFSVDAVGKAEVHFPKSEEYNVAFEGQRESAWLLSSGSFLTIPAEDGALKLTHPGPDHLVVLFSTQRIKPEYIEYLGLELSRNKENLEDQLFRLLEKHLIPAADITYHPSRMGFEVSTRSAGKIVPVVLTVEVNP